MLRQGSRASELPDWVRLGVTAIIQESRRVTSQLPLTVQIAMESINRFLYGPSPEVRVREWQTKLRKESRVLDREIQQVGRLGVDGVYP